MSAPTCHHVHPTGQPCGSPALRGEQFCFFHHPTRRRPRTPGRKPTPPIFHLPPSLADPASIQRALAKILSRVVSRRLNHDKAGLMVFALQLANQNLPCPSRQLGARIHQALQSLGFAAFDPAADILSNLLGDLRPPRPTHKKCTRSKPNPRGTIAKIYLPPQGVYQIQAPVPHQPASHCLEDHAENR
jgi:hypothetical protein